MARETRLDQAKRSHALTAVAIEIAERLTHWDLYDRSIIMREANQYLGIDEENKSLEELTKEMLDR